MRQLAIIFASVLFFCGVPVFGQSSGTTTDTKSLRVQTRLVAPFVEKGPDGKLTGFSIDLWDAIAREANLRYTLAVSPTVSDLLEQVGHHNADLAISAVSITAERDLKYDFSQPIFNAGLQILVTGSGGGGKDSGDAGGSLSPEVVLHNLLSPTVAKLFGWLMLLAVFVAHIIWLLERNHPDGLPETKKYIPGIFKATWWAAATLGAQADQMPKTYAARIVAVLLMFTSALSIAYFTAAVTAQITVQQLGGLIHGPDDLPGKRVATTAGSTAEAYLKANNSIVQSFDTIDQAYDALLNAKVDAVVSDAPILMYYSAHEGKDKTRIVGPVFKKEDYGIVFPPGSPLNKRVNVTLLKLKENGAYDNIYNKWFSSNGNAQ